MRLYCIGTAKSGTHSIAQMFSEVVRAEHEPQAADVIQKILDFDANLISRKDLVRWICKRDAKLALRVDSSQLNFFLLEHLLEQFPNARFILTIRDCYSWLDSFINHVLHYPAGPETLRFRDYRFSSGRFPHAPEEKALQERGLHTLDGYLLYWSMHNSHAIASVPRDRMLIVRTDQIRQRAFEIAEFAGLPRDSVEVERTHAFSNREKFHVLRQIERQYLQDKVEKHCGLLMRRFFSEIKSVEDARL